MKTLNRKRVEGAVGQRAARRIPLVVGGQGRKAYEIRRGGETGAWWAVIAMVGGVIWLAAAAAGWVRL